MSKYLRRPGREGSPPYAALVAFDRGMKAPVIAKALGRTERQVWRWKAWIRDHPAKVTYELGRLREYDMTDIERSLGVTDI